MWRSALWVGSLAMGCAPAPSEQPKHAQTAPPPVISLPAAQPEPDAGTTSGEASALPDASAAASGEGSSDASAFASAAGDASAEPTPLSPPLPVAFGILNRKPQQAQLFSSAEVILFKRRVSCQDATRPDHPDRVFSLGVEWSTSHKSTISKTSIKNGQIERYRTNFEIISAPTRVGALGKLRLATGPEFNIGGGDVPVLVCN